MTPLQPSFDLSADGIAALVEAYPFPDPEMAYADGLLAMGGDLSSGRLISAYAQGIFPWYSVPPIKWFCPDPRLVLRPPDIHISRSLSKVLGSGRFQVSFDRDFPAVIRQCAVLREDDGTWITNEMEVAYCHLHELGIAHSVEVWQNNELVGGLYGVALGAVFFGESMFHTATDASKVALVELARLLTDWQFPLIDCQIETEHLLRMGAKTIPRDDFLAEVRVAVLQPMRLGAWHSSELG